jgi:hypothetical protein
VPCADRPARTEVPEQREQPESRDEVQPRPLGRGAQPEAQARGDAPPSDPQARPEGEQTRPAGDPIGEPCACDVAVDQQASEPGQRPEHHEDVQQAGAAVHEVVAVDGEQQARGGTQQRGTEQPPGDPGQHEDRQRADHRRGERHTGWRARSAIDRDHPRQRRVDDEVGAVDEDVRVAVGERPSGFGDTRSLLFQRSS